MKRYNYLAFICIAVSLLSGIKIHGNTIINKGVSEVKTIPEKIRNQVMSPIIDSIWFKDDLGEHCILISNSFSQASEGIDTRTLSAVQFLSNGNSWTKEWQIKDWVNCEGLDLEARFLRDLFTFTDLDSNGIIETTVAYYLICTGGVAAKPTKVIMRQGDTKYAVRGESFVYIDDTYQLGGTFKADECLNAKPVIKEHLIEIWKKAANLK